MEAGYKGFGLALIIGLLAGTLNGAAMGKDVIDFNHDDASATNTGQALLVIDPAAFGDVTAFKQRVDAVVRDLVERTFGAAEERSAASILVSGGVAANSRLRAECERRARTSGAEGSTNPSITTSASATSRRARSSPSGRPRSRLIDRLPWFHWLK